MSLAAQCVGLPDPILCFYINKTLQTQIVRFVTKDGIPCERIIRSTEHLLFEASPNASLEVHALTSKNTILLTSFSCKDLKVSNDLIETMLQWLA